MSDFWSADPTAAPAPLWWHGDKVTSAAPASQHSGLLPNLSLIGMARGIAHAAASAATLPGDVYAGTATVPQSAALSPAGVEDTTNIGRVTDLAGIVPLSSAPRVAMASAVAAPTADALKTTARTQYNHPDVLGVQIRPETAVGLRNFIKNDLETGPNSGFRASTQPNTFSAINELTNPLQSGAIAAGGPIKIADVDAVRKVLGRVSQDFSRPSDAAAAARATAHIDDFLTNLKQPDLIAGDAAKASAILQDARGNWGAGARSQEVTNTLGNAELNASSAHSGTNIDNATRQAFKPLLKDDARRLGGYSPAEIAQRSKIVSGTLPGNIARATGSILGGGGGLGALASAGAGYAAAGPAGLAAPVAGYFAKTLGNMSTARSVNVLDEMLRSRSPLAQSAPVVQPTAMQTGAQHAAFIAALRGILEGYSGEQGQ